jgi:replicative DNA helicase
MSDHIVMKLRKSLLTAMLMDEKAVNTAAEVITGSDFYDPQKGVVFDALVDIVGNGGKCDPTTLQEYLKRKNVPQEVSSTEYIMALIDGIAFPGNAEAYANIIAEKAVLRRLISVNEKIEAECYSDSSSLEDILGDTEAQIFSGPAETKYIRICSDKEDSSSGAS